MDTNINSSYQKFDDSIVNEVLSVGPNYPTLTSQLLFLMKKNYFKWDGTIQALFLQFHLIQMQNSPSKIPSFTQTSRKHINFDDRFSDFVLNKINVEESEVNEIKRHLKKVCKTKFATMKRKFKNTKKGDDYESLIPKLVKNKFTDNEYPELFKELQKWESLKSENQQLFMKEEGRTKINRTKKISKGFNRPKNQSKQQ